MPKISDIESILTIVRQNIQTDNLLKNIDLAVNIIEIKNYKGMAFIKVRDDTASISAVIYASYYDNDLSAGDKMKINATLMLYNGQVQLLVKSYQKLGIIDNNQFSITKAKLEKLGYFNAKPALSTNYTKIGIVSSINAAGMKDFLHTINQRCINKQLYIYPASVQGVSAVQELSDAIVLANTHNAVEIIVLIRGGGSKDDLKCFNSENLAKAIHASKIPVVTGIGHQIDTSIADLVSVKSFITPTAVAQSITTENTSSSKLIVKLLYNIKKKIQYYFNNSENHITNYHAKLDKYYHSMVEFYQSDKLRYNNTSKLIGNRVHTIMDNYYNYIVNSQQQFSSEFEYETILKQCQIQLAIQVEKCDRVIQSYSQACNTLAQPVIIDQLGNTIISKADLIPHNRYQIIFIDGVYNLNT